MCILQSFEYFCQTIASILGLVVGMGRLEQTRIPGAPVSATQTASGTFTGYQMQVMVDWVVRATLQNAVTHGKASGVYGSSSAHCSTG